MSVKKHKIYRSSVTGQIVTKAFALANPRETVCETVKTEIVETVEYEAANSEDAPENVEK